MIGPNMGPIGMLERSGGQTDGMGACSRSYCMGYMGYMGCMGERADRAKSEDADRGRSAAVINGATRYADRASKVVSECETAKRLASIWPSCGHFRVKSRDRRWRHVMIPNQPGTNMSSCAKSRAFQWYLAAGDTMRVGRAITV
ncbi:hypothetical protein BCR44DRAFT_1444457 [Catenaria anguillulae PL171]|uniref:Uncharacterized protein n=1 Tax=Catenaria anguillulae PL171 TaxID=765915 RepID=A0A1Y2H7X9_9FUNG|nr:hypothetical protein BCR44DRAFT_1444431 [Catenaria anguillulae PL171]ORZ30622.1 hypothetical protein BCR44DRAFT_1444457 [Catenaria anguillulae PL171]